MSNDSNVTGPVTLTGGSAEVVLRGVAVAFASPVGAEFVCDCARHTEGLLSEIDIKAKWGMRDAEWAALAVNTSFLDAVRSERERRVRGGEAAREAAQRHFAMAPTVLGQILNNEQIAPRHRIEAAKELRQAAGARDKSEGVKEKFIIHIDLGGGEKPFHYETEIVRGGPSLIDDGEEQ